MSRYVRAGGALGHLLLVVVLAFGVFAMHTLGHPDGSSGHGAATASHASTMDGASEAHDTAVTAAAAEPSHAMASSHSSSGDSADHPAMAMDMLSLCLAVLLSVYVLAALLKAALASRPDWLANLLAQATVAQRPNPPPRGPDLTQLSVLRL
ncbi:DUF6153 family protein [Streptomyces sp. NPDC002896]|uniref:DUF6153 family protein n=1 Tax=Streptomyces sp. NPDC002896 TaxID=3154438 RepID=UPI00331ACB15